ncbi:MAG: long-chain-fatty-acid--CoA ligase [Chloroflexi bacterium]|nr:long-chain-fatty-acid--CoA ligase [Chloroflexota bacterium]
MWQLLAKNAEEQPEREAVALGGRRLSYGEITAQAERLAAALYKHGLRKGDHLALIMPNWPEFIIVYFATARLGAVLVPLNVRFRQNEIDYILRNSEAKFLLTCAEFGDFDFIGLIGKLRGHLPALQHVIVVGQAAGAPGIIAWESLMGEAQPDTLPPIKIDPKEDLLMLLYTSGTTGLPKGAMLTHFNIIWNSTIMALALECTSKDVILGAVPLFHIFGTTGCITLAALLGASLVLMDIFKPDAALRLIQQERITVHHGVPTMFILELNQPDFANYDLTSMRTGIIAAAPAPSEIIRRIRREMGCEIASAYGLTETSPALTFTRFTDDDEVRAETVGKAVPGVEIKIVDDDDEALPSGEVGELVCRSPGLMKGYYKMDEANYGAIDNDGWFSTGDLATIDADGNVRIVGRKKEMINRAGFKVYPREVEELYYHHPKVQEIAIIGLIDPVLGEKTCACIKLKAYETATAEEMRDFARNKVADFKIPDMVRFVDGFPMTASGKIKKVTMRAEIAKQEE